MRVILLPAPKISCRFSLEKKRFLSPFFQHRSVCWETSSGLPLGRSTPAGAKDDPILCLLHRNGEGRAYLVRSAGAESMFVTVNRKNTQIFNGLAFWHTACIVLGSTANNPSMAAGDDNDVMR